MCHTDADRNTDADSGRFCFRFRAGPFWTGSVGFETKETIRTFQWGHFVVPFVHLHNNQLTPDRDYLVRKTKTHRHHHHHPMVLSSGSQSIQPLLQYLTSSLFSISVSLLWFASCFVLWFLNKLKSFKRCLSHFARGNPTCIRMIKASDHHYPHRTGPNTLLGNHTNKNEGDRLLTLSLGLPSRQDQEDNGAFPLSLRCVLSQGTHSTTEKWPGRR